MTHTAVDEGLWASIQAIVARCYSLRMIKWRRETYTYFASTLTFFQLGTSCRVSLPGCQPVLTCSVDTTPLGDYTYIVLCAMDLTYPGYHYRSNTLAHDGSIDIKLLGDLLDGSVPVL